MHELESKARERRDGRVLHQTDSRPVRTDGCARTLTQATADGARDCVGGTVNQRRDALRSLDEERTAARDAFDLDALAGAAFSAAAHAEAILAAVAVYGTFVLVRLAYVVRGDGAADAGGLAPIRAQVTFTTVAVCLAIGVDAAPDGVTTLAEPVCSAICIRETTVGADEHGRLSSIVATEAVGERRAVCVGGARCRQGTFSRPNVGPRQNGVALHVRRWSMAQAVASAFFDAGRRRAREDRRRLPATRGTFPGGRGAVLAWSRVIGVRRAFDLGGRVAVFESVTGAGVGTQAEGGEQTEPQEIYSMMHDVFSVDAAHVVPMHWT